MPRAVDPTVFPHPELRQHALIDSGGGEKLERFGDVLLVRPDPQALWRRRRPDRWREADLVFVRESDRGGRWEARDGAHPSARGKDPCWTVDVRGARMTIRPTPFKHVGLFPEQATNWDWVAGLAGSFEGEPPRLLNLFGYSGAASVLAARAGYRVTHVDASRASLRWTRENAEGSGLAADELRVICEDALVFARREVRRGSRYAGILLDPPHYGRGPKGEVWRLEEGLAPLLEACAALLDERAFLVLTAYAVGYSPLAFTNLLTELAGGAVSAGELALPEEPDDAGRRRLLPCGFCARWWRGLEAEEPGP
jgi:23S rRNA (cytosine1962-C5)-methyltransferase